MRITFVIPVYNERDTLEALVEGITEHVGSHEHRILFVADGSTDGSYDVLCRLRERFATVDIIRFRRNFGKSAALAAGFARAEGDLLFTMDADLQDDPKEIPRFIEKLNEGYDVVSGWKAVRRDPWHKRFSSRIYNWFTSRVFRLGIHDINCGYKLYRTEVVKRIPMYGGLHRLTPALAASLGYRIAELTVEHHPRRFGVSKYGLERFWRGALDILAVWFLSRHLHTPGHFFGKLGFAAVGLGSLSAFAGVFGWLFLDATAVFAAMLVIGVILLMTGLGLIGLGLVAELLLRRCAPADPSVYIAEEHIRNS